MPLDLVQVGVAMARGLSAVCATCQKYWRAREQGVAGDTCLSKLGCGSPLSGNDFHEYEGPVTDFRTMCFVCGKKPSYGVRVKGSVRTVAVCKEHVRMLNELRPEGRHVQAVSVVDARGSDVKVREQEVKSLATAIFEVERYHADKDGRSL